LPRVKVVDQLRDGARRATELPKRSARGIKAGARDLGSVPKWIGRSAGNAGRTVGRTVTRLPSRATELVRGDGTEATAEPGTSATGDGVIDRARENPRHAIAIVGGGLLLIAWIAWAIYVTSAHGARAGLGVVLSWPVLLGALILIALPFVGIYLLIRRLQDGGGETGTAEAPAAEDEDFEEAAEDEQEDDDSEEDEESDEDDGEEAEDEDDAEEPSDEDTDSTAKAASG
jgi:hypothetical protein